VERQIESQQRVLDLDALIARHKEAAGFVWPGGLVAQMKHLAGLGVDQKGVDTEFRNLMRELNKARTLGAATFTDPGEKRIKSMIQIVQAWKTASTGPAEIWKFLVEVLTTIGIDSEVFPKEVPVNLRNINGTGKH
jgi:hypothetical protein